MATVTLAESAKLAQDQLVAGVIDEIISVNPIFELLPFTAIDGNSLAYNRLLALGDVQSLGVGGTITAKAPATFSKVNTSLTKIIGDAEVDKMIQATRSDINDQKAIQVASKAKAVARSFQNQMVNGSGTGDEFTGLRGLVAAAQKIAADTAGSTTNGGVLSFALLDQLIDSVLDKDGQVDYLMMTAREIRQYYGLLRALGGTTPNDMYTLPSGRQVPQYRGVPMFRNDWIPTNLVTGSATTSSVVFAGTFDDGSNSHGIAGLTAANSAGIVVEDVGTSETKDEDITRVKWYCSLANFNQKGLSALTGVTAPAGF